MCPSPPAWVPVDRAAIIQKNHGPGKSPKRVLIHDEPLALYWDAKRHTPSITADSCWHRGASLSVGQVRNDGSLCCKYHGHPTKGKHRRVRVRDGIIWYDPTGSVSDSYLPSSWEFQGQDPQRVYTYCRDFPDTNPLLMTENTLDHAHLSHIHAFSATSGEPEVTIHSETRATYSYATTMDGVTLDVENEWFAPFSTCLRFLFNGAHAFSLHFCFVPHGYAHTSLIVRVTRDASKDPLPLLSSMGDVLLMLSNELPLIEDRWIVQSIPETRKWTDDSLHVEDQFLKQYRDHIQREYPDLYARYALGACRKQ